LEQVRSARPRRYCFYYDEVAEAEAQGPYVLVPRTLSRESRFFQGDVLGRLLAAIDKERKRRELEEAKEAGEDMPVLGK
jgi:hypothetical protein